MTIAKLRAARQLWARVAEVVGEPDAGAATRARRDVAADDGATRSVGEHAAHHAGRVLRRGRWRRYRAGASIRCGHSRRLPRYRSEFRAAHRAQHPAAAAGGIAHRPGARPRRGIVVRRGPHRTAGRAGVEALPGHRIPRRVRRGPRLRHRARSPRWPTAASTTSRTGAPRSPVSTSTPTWRNRRCRRVIRPQSVRPATQPASRRCATARMRFLEKTGSRPQVLLLPLGPLAEHNIRTTFAVESARLRRHRGRHAADAQRRRDDVAVICGTDARYATEASAAVDAAQ